MHCEPCMFLPDIVNMRLSDTASRTMCACALIPRLTVTGNRWARLRLTIYTAAGMNDGLHYAASNTAQCTKQLKAIKVRDASASWQITYWLAKWLDSRSNIWLWMQIRSKCESDKCGKRLQTGPGPLCLLLLLRHPLPWLDVGLSAWSCAKFAV